MHVFALTCRAGLAGSGVQLPPTETPEIIDGDLDIPHMVAHLYTDKSEPTALCGITGKNDPHNRMHRAEGLPHFSWRPGVKACSCGAPCCEVCYVLAMKASGH